MKAVTVTATTAAAAAVAAAAWATAAAERYLSTRILPRNMKICGKSNYQKF